MIAPVIEQWSDGADEDLKDKVVYYKFDVDSVPELAEELGVRAMPTFFIFKAGEAEPAETIVGANPRAMKAGIQKVLGA